MHIKTIVILLICFNNFCFAQNLVITGKVDYFQLQKTGKIYYTFPGKPFAENRFVRYNAQRNYQFSMAIAEIRKKNIQTVIFAADKTVDAGNVYACVHRIHVGEIVGDARFSGKKTISLKSDLLLTFHCIDVPADGATKRGKQQFVGTYRLTANDTTHLISLEDGLFTYRGTLQQETAGFMNGEFGSWDYDSGKNMLTLNIWLQMNDRFGPMQRKSYSYNFVVAERDGRLQFSNAGAVLVKE
jgi:hypothetical protein